MRNWRLSRRSHEVSLVRILYSTVMTKINTKWLIQRSNEYCNIRRTGCRISGKQANTYMRRCGEITYRHSLTNRSSSIFLPSPPIFPYKILLSFFSDSHGMEDFPELSLRAHCKGTSFIPYRGSIWRCWVLMGKGRVPDLEAPRHWRRSL